MVNKEEVNDYLQIYELATIAGSLVIGFTLCLAFNSTIALQAIVLGIASLIGLCGVGLLTAAKYKLLKR